MKRRSGRGLGLWQLKWAVDQLDGDVTFEVSGGTTVRITVPDRGVQKRE